MRNIRLKSDGGELLQDSGTDEQLGSETPDVQTAADASSDGSDHVVTGRLKVKYQR